MARDLDEHRQELILSSALSHWETIAAFAWRCYEQLGRGAVMVHRDDLVSVDPANGALPMDYIAAAEIPSGDDFAQPISSYDPTRQVALLIGAPGEEEHLLILEPAGKGRPAPPEA